jgi:hypothetical protein
LQGRGRQDSAGAEVDRSALANGQGCRIAISRELERFFTRQYRQGWGWPAVNACGDHYHAEAIYGWIAELSDHGGIEGKPLRLLLLERNANQLAQTSRALVEHHSRLLQSIEGTLRKRRRDGDTNVTPLIATSFSNLAAMQSAIERQEEALNAAEEAVSPRRQLVSAKPDAFLSDLATSLHTLAITTLSEAISIRRRAKA